MSDFLSKLKDQVLLGDGAVGTLLYSKGIFINRCFDEINLSAPKMVKEIYQDYRNAGADFLTTNTFGGNYFRLKTHGLEDKVKEINQAGVALAREVAKGDLFVAGSIGPLNVTIEPYGMLTETQALEAFSEQATYLAEANIDFFILETFYYLHEALIAVQAIKKVSKLPIVAQVTIDKEGTTLAKEPPERFTKELDRIGADVIGINCSTGPQGVLEAVEIMLKNTNKPIIVQPNAGIPKMIEGRLIYLSTPEYFATYAKSFVQMGVRIVGGCCGTTPEHIKEMKSAIRSVSPVTKKVEIINYQDKAKGVAPVPSENKSRFAKKIINKEFVTSVEITPPRGCDPSKVLLSSQLLKEKGVDAINIPDGPRASSRMSAMVLAQLIEQRVGIESIMHYTCRDRNILGMQSDLLGACAAGLRNILIVTGDPPKMGAHPEATAVFDVDSIGLTRIVNNFNHGLDIGSNEIGQPTSYYIGVGVNPGSLDFNHELDRFHKKVEAGAEFAITQPVFDVEVLYRFLDAIKKLNIPIIAGIWPLVSFRNAEFMNNEVPGVHVSGDIMERLKKAPNNDSAREEGILIAHETLLTVKDKIQGVQVSAPFGKVEYALQVLGI